MKKRLVRPEGTAKSKPCFEMMLTANPGIITHELGWSNGLV
jgi:hypothetical protein